MTSLENEDLFNVSSHNINMKHIAGKVGSYAVSTVDFSDWTNEPVTQLPSKLRKPRGTKDVIHKILVECASITDDPFWIDKFRNGSIGKLPPKFNFHDGTLTYRKGAKCNTLEVSNNPYEAATACMEFFRVNGGIFSPTDEQNSLTLQYTRAHAVLDQKELTWELASKKVQDCLLSYYVIDMKKIMNLSLSSSEQLRQTIRLGIGNKYFGKHNILVKSNRINSIQGLLFNTDLLIFYIDPELKPKTTRTYARKKDGTSSVDPSQKDTVPQFGIKWRKYVDSLDKKIIQYSRRLRRVSINQPLPHSLHLQVITSASPLSLTSDHSDSSHDDDDDDSDVD